MLEQLKTTARNLDENIGLIFNVKKFTALYSQYRSLFLPILIIGLLANIYELTEFSLHLDSEMEGYKNGPHYIWLQNGRWAAFLINGLLLPDPVIPAIPMLISVMGIVIASNILLITLTPTRTTRDYLAAAIFVSLPIHYFAFYYYSLGYVMGIAFVLSAISIYSLEKYSHKKSFFIMLACFTFSIGIYQSMILVIATMFCLYILNKIIEDDIDITFILQKSLLVFSCAIASIFLNKIIGSVWLMFEGKQYNQAYIDGFNNFELSFTYLKEFIPSSLANLKKYYLGNEHYYLYNLLSLKLLFLLSLTITICKILCAPKNINVKLLGFAFLLFLLIAPALMLLMGGSRENPPRTMGSTAIVLFSLVFIASSVKSNLLKTAVTILVVICCTNFIIINQRYALSSHLAWQADRDFSNHLLIRINEVSYKLPKKQKIKNKKLGISTRSHPLVIVGDREKYSGSPLFVRRNVVGASFYNWTSGAVHKIIALWGSMGNFDYWPASRTERRSVIKYAINMPIWPDKGSVDVFNGIVVIRLGDYTSAEVKVLCFEKEKPLGCKKLLKTKSL